MFHDFRLMWDEQPSELCFLLLLPVLKENYTDCSSPASLCTRPYLQQLGLRSRHGCVSSLSPCESLGLCLDLYVDRDLCSLCHCRNKAPHPVPTDGIFQEACHFLTVLLIDECIVYKFTCKVFGGVRWKNVTAELPMKLVIHL